MSPAIARLIACVAAIAPTACAPQQLPAPSRNPEETLGSKRLVSAVAGFASRWDADYDANGHMTGWVRSVLDENGLTTDAIRQTLAWDGDRLTSVSPYYTEAQRVDFESDQRGRIVLVRDGNGERTLAYDDDDNLVAIVTGDSVRSLAYRDDGQLESVSVDDSVPALLEYDDDGRLITVPRGIVNRSLTGDTVGPFTYRDGKLDGPQYDDDGTMIALLNEDGEATWQYEWETTDAPASVWPTPGSFGFGQIPLPVFFRPDGTSDATLRDRDKIIRLFARLNAYDGD